MSHINKQAEQESLDLVFESSHSARRSRRSNKECLQLLVSSKLEEGDFRAVKLACSDDSLAPVNSFTDGVKIN